MVFGAPPSNVMTGRNIATAIDHHRGIPGNTFFSYEEILIFFQRAGMTDWELVRPNTIFCGREAWTYVLRDIKPRNTVLGSTAHSNS
jgi:hypothetical protein